MFVPTNSLNLDSIPTFMVKHESSEFLYILCKNSGVVLIVDSFKNRIIDSFPIDLPFDKILLDQEREIIYLVDFDFGNISIYEKGEKENYEEVHTITMENILEAYIDQKNNLFYVFTSGHATSYSLIDYTHVSTLISDGVIRADLRDSSLYQTTTTAAPTSLDKYLIFSSSTENNVYKYSLSSPLTQEIFPVGLRPESIELVRGAHSLYAANYNSEFISLIDLTSGAVTHIPTKKGVVDLAFSIKNNLLYALNNSVDRCFVLDANNNYRLISEIPLPELSINIVVNDDFDQVFIASEQDASLMIINTYDFSVSQTIDLPFKPSSMSADRNLKQLILTSSEPQSIYRISMTDLSPVNISNISRPSLSFVDEENSLLLCISQQHDLVTIFNLRDNNLQSVLKTYNSPSSVAVDTDLQNIYISNTLSDSISIYDYSSFSLKSQISTPENPDNLIIYNASFPTTTTTQPPVFNASVTITSNSNYASETNLIFYGELGDTIEYTYIPIQDISQPPSFLEILIYDSAGLINRLTLPKEYVEQNINFTLTSNGAIYSGSFGSGAELDSYRRIEFT